MKDIGWWDWYIGYIGVGKKFTGHNFYKTLGNNEVSCKLGANNFLILITFLSAAWNSFS